MLYQQIFSLSLNYPGGMIAQWLALTSYSRGSIPGPVGTFLGACSSCARVGYLWALGQFTPPISKHAMRPLMAAANSQYPRG